MGNVDPSKSNTWIKKMGFQIFECPIKFGGKRIDMKYHLKKKEKKIIIIIII